MRSIQYLLILAGAGEARRMNELVKEKLTGGQIFGPIRSVRILSLESPTTDEVMRIASQITATLAMKNPDEHVVFAQDTFQSMCTDPVTVEDVLADVPFEGLVTLTGLDEASLRNRIHTADGVGLSSVLFGDKGESYYEVLKAFARQLEKANTVAPA